MKTFFGVLYLKPHEWWGFPEWLLRRGSLLSPGWALSTVVPFNPLRPFSPQPGVVFYKFTHLCWPLSPLGVLCPWTLATLDCTFQPLGVFHAPPGIPHLVLQPGNSFKGITQSVAVLILFVFHLSGVTVLCCLMANVFRTLFYIFCQQLTAVSVGR